MESLEKTLFRSITHDSADLQEQLAAGGFVVGAATTRDSDCNTDRNDISDINDSAGTSNDAFDRKDITDSKTDTEENDNGTSTHPPSGDLDCTADNDTRSIHKDENDNATASEIKTADRADRRTTKPPFVIRPP